MPAENTYFPSVSRWGSSLLIISLPKFKLILYRTLDRRKKLVEQKVCFCGFYSSFHFTCNKVTFKVYFCFNQHIGFFLLPGWLPITARESRLSCYVMHSRWEEKTDSHVSRVYIRKSGGNKLDRNSKFSFRVTNSYTTGII